VKLHTGAPRASDPDPVLAQRGSRQQVVILLVRVAKSLRDLQREPACSRLSLQARRVFPVEKMAENGDPWGLFSAPFPAEPIRASWPL
jgi:hypothetical protein